MAFCAEKTQSAGDGEVVDIVAGHCAVFAITTEAREADGDETGIQLAEGCKRIEAKLFEHAGAKRVDQNVSVWNKGKEDGVGGRRFEVEGYGGLGLGE